MEIYLWINEEEYGPYSLEEIHAYKAEGRILSDTLSWVDPAEKQPLDQLLEKLETQGSQSATETATRPSLVTVKKASSSQQAALKVTTSTPLPKTTVLSKNTSAPPAVEIQGSLARGLAADLQNSTPISTSSQEIQVTPDNSTSAGIENSVSSTNASQNPETPPATSKVLIILASLLLLVLVCVLVFLFFPKKKAVLGDATKELTAAKIILDTWAEEHNQTLPSPEQGRELLRAEGLNEVILYEKIGIFTYKLYHAGEDGVLKTKDDSIQNWELPAQD